MITRRNTLKTFTAGIVTACSTQLVFAETKLRVRRDLQGMAMDDPDLATYRDFVGLMKSYDQTKPLSWLGFSLQHGWISKDGTQGDYKFCPHGDWYFLPWHRAFVLMYEEAARVIMKNPDFAMPYWDWTANRDYPEAFSAKVYNGKPNPLYVAGRHKLAGDYALTDDIVGQDIIDQIYKETDFENFGTSRYNQKGVVQNSLDPSWVTKGGGHQGFLENPAHNYVHNNIGAYMPTPASPRDPIFFMHHTNIDRIWARWNALGRKNSSDSLWLDMPFANNYLDPTGQPYTKIVRELQNTTDYGYTYPNMPTPDGVVPHPERVTSLLAMHKTSSGNKIAGVQSVTGGTKMRSLGGEPLNSPHKMEADSLNAVTAPLKAGDRQKEVFARISGIHLDANVSHIRVFINKEGLSLETPVTDPSFVRVVSFLAHPGNALQAADHKADKPGHSVLVNLTKTIKALGIKHFDKDTIHVQLQPVPNPGMIVEQTGLVSADSIQIVVI
jgi:tyrosinase